MKDELVSCKNWSRGLIMTSNVGIWNSAEEGGNDLAMIFMKEKVVDTEIDFNPSSRRASCTLRMARTRIFDGSDVVGEEMTSLPTEIAEILERG